MGKFARSQSLLALCTLKRENCIFPIFWPMSTSSTAVCLDLFFGSTSLEIFLLMCYHPEGISDHLWQEGNPYMVTFRLGECSEL